MPNASIKVSLLIDSEIFARGVEYTLQKLAHDDVELAVQSIDEAVAAIGRGDIDILVLDSELSARVVPHLPPLENKPRILMVSERNHAGIRLPIRQCDACGFFPARAPESRLKHYLDRIIDCTRRSFGRDACNKCPVPGSLKPRDLLLTRREAEVFEEIGLLRTNREIAEKLNISTKTIEAHADNIKQKLNLENSRHLLQAAIDWVEGR
ncbi:DNA-binding response regulator [Wenzhouxiangella sp. 15181]|nr:DNA-binding response regulator [Wenzhouxiangella sp. 15181]RFP67285.1 DNA-binding response regulator [Wenzhouxiangella sp. 15190]